MIPGVFASDRHIVGTKKGDFASGILKVHPTGAAPLFALSAGMKSSKASDTVVTWFEEQHISGRATVSTGGNSAATSIVVDDGSQYVAGCILMVEETAEYLFVSNVVSNTLTIERGFGGSTAATINTNHHVQRLGTAHEEGSSRPVAQGNLGTPKFNFTQIFRNSWDVTGTARAVEFTTGNLVAKNRADCGVYHAEDIERMIWFGRQSVGVRNGKPWRTMDGVATMISTNVQSATTVTYATMDAFLQGVFAKNIKGEPNERIAFCGNGFLSILQQVAINNSQLALMPVATEFGMNITKWVSPYGTISLLSHPLLNESPLWTKDLYVLHPAAIETRYLRNTSEDSYDSDGRRAGVDADYGVYTTEMTITMAAEMTAGKWIGATTAGT